MSIADAIEALYTAFADQPAPTAVDGCTHCCTTPERLARLVSVPQRDLSDEEVRDFAFNAACGTVGTDADLVYFLPRILEAFSRDIEGFPEPEVVVSKLPRCGIDTWSPERRDALAAFFVAWLDVVDELLDASELGPWMSDMHDVDTLVTTIALSGLPMGPFLTEVERRPALLWQYHASQSAKLGHQVLLKNPYWSSAADGDTTRDLVSDWLSSDRVEQLLLSIIDEMV